MSKSNFAGHNGSSGICNHSCGEFYPVRSYCIGSADHRVAEFCGVRRDSYDSAGHDDNLRRMKLAEVIADAIYANPAGGSHFVNRADSPDRGYCVGLAGHETRISLAGPSYPAVYADVVGKLEWLDAAGRDDVDVCIGWWTREGITYLDISAVFYDRAEALAYADCAGQLAIYDIANRCDIDIRYV